MRATSSIRSASIAISNRWLGAVTTQPPSVDSTFIVNLVRICATSASSISRPRSRVRRSLLKVISARTGKCLLTVSSTSGPASPPAISNNNCVARSIALPCPAGSTPRSKRIDASVCMPYARARPAMKSCGQNAASKKTSVVLSVTAVLSPPMMPAIPIGPLSSVITSVSAFSSTSLSSSNVTFSPDFANRGFIAPWSRPKS